jgi:hypothetical protein
MVARSVLVGIEYSIDLCCRSSFASAKFVVHKLDRCFSCAVTE